MIRWSAARATTPMSIPRGLDTLQDPSGADILKFGAGITLANLRVTVSPTSDLDAYIYVNGVLSIIIEDMFSTNGVIETFRFADGSTFNAGAMIAPRNGTTGNDTLTGADSAIFQNDYLYGLNGDDRLIGGLGDDRLFGGAGNDTYVVTQGHDYVQDQTGTDTIEFGAGYLLANADLTRSGNNLIVSFGGTVAVTIYGQFDNNAAIERLTFQGGGVIDLLAVNYQYQGTANRDYLYGVSTGAGGDIMSGLGGDDVIYGYGGDDVIDGGPGNDTLNGGAGDDRYVYSSGFDVIGEGGGIDTIDFRAVALERLGFVRSGYDLIITVDGVAALGVDNQFTANGQVERIVFGDGRSIDLLSIVYEFSGDSSSERIDGIDYGGNINDRLFGNGGNDLLYGRNGNDLLDGGAGDDQLFGGAGNDSYHVGTGSNYISDGGTAQDTLDAVYLPTGVAFAGLTLQRRADGDLIISWTGGDLVIDRAYDPAYAIERLVIAGGATYNLLTLAIPTIGTSADDQIGGNTQALGSHDDVIRGLAGDDVLYGYDGNDTLDGGDGSDQMSGADGNDIYLVSGADTIGDTSGADRIVLPTGIAFADISYYRLGDGDLVLLWNGGSVRIDNGLNQDRAVETLQTAGGATLLLANQHYITVGSSAADSLGGNQEALGSRDDDMRGLGGDDRLTSYDGNDLLDGGAGDDTMDGGAGADVYMAGDGNDFIDETGQTTDAADRIVLAAGIRPADVAMSRAADGDIILDWTTGSVRIDNGYDQRSAIEELQFATGEVWQILTRDVTTIGSSGNDSLAANREEMGSRNDTMRGLEGDDSLNGYDGADILDGGLGNDSMYGADGNDTYVVGYGWDYVQDSGTAGDTSDTVRIDRAGITAANLAFSRLSTGDIQISWNAGADGVTLYRGLTGNNAIEFVLLADGTRLTLANQTFQTVTVPTNLTVTGDATANTLTGGDGADTVRGLDGDDSLDGKAGNDLLYGGNGNDSYMVGLGHDIISDAGRTTDTADRILLTENVSRAALTFTRGSNGSLLISWGTGDVTIDRAFDLGLRRGDAGAQGRNGHRPENRGFRNGGNDRGRHALRQPGGVRIARRRGARPRGKRHALRI